MRLRAVGWGLCGLLSSAGCITSRFDQVVAAAAVTELGCAGQPHAVVELAPWGYRVDGCGPPRYYRCHFGREGGPGSQCCQQVAEASEAIDVFHPISTTPATCVVFPLFSK